MAEVLKKFGRYFLLDRIAQGGMAEIYRSRLASVDGAGRLIVIKRIQTGFGSNAEFVTMFKSEIKVTMGFNHPNIVQVYDFGEEQEQPYIAMEFVDGKNLRQFLSRFSELKQTFPIDLASYIIEQSASGLQYAHQFKDKISGEPLNIIHRDISPQNILISYEGNVKVIDFGIAKAATNSESTRAGVIKGKPSYLSPEQITGEVLDARCDIFALGVVMWELLTGRKLFAGENDLAVLKLIESCNTHVKPPSTQNSAVPKELDYIVLKALAKQRENRYQTAEEFRRALHKFVYSFNPDFNPADLSYYAKDLFKGEIVEDRKRIQKLNEKAEQLLASEHQQMIEINSHGGSSKTQKKDDTTTVFELRDQDATEGRLSRGAGRVEFEALPEGANSARPSSQRSRPSGRGATSTSASVRDREKERSNFSARKVPATSSQNQGGGLFRNVLFGVAVLLAVAVIGPEWIKIPVLSDLISGRRPNSAGDSQLELQGSARGVKISINGRAIPQDSLPVTLRNLPSGQTLEVSVTGPGGKFNETVSLSKGESKSIRVRGVGTSEEESLSARDRSIALRVNVTPGGPATASLNGKAFDPSQPLPKVPFDELLDLVVEKPGYKATRHEFVLSSKEFAGRSEWTVDIALEPLKFGFLTIRTTPSSEAIITPREAIRTPSSDAKPWVRKTPFDSEKLPVGVYNVRLVNEVLGMEAVETVTVQEGKIVHLDVRLQVKN